MHREISHADNTFANEPKLELWVLLVFIGGLVAADLWPAMVEWIGPWGLGLPTWPREIMGQRLALVAAVMGSRVSDSADARCTFSANTERRHY